MVSTRTARNAGISAAVLFWTALPVMAALYPGYSHYTRAISELGAFGAPHALAWNLLGFAVPGVLLAISGAGIARSIDGRRTLLFWLLVLSALSLTGAGAFPAEMHDGSPAMRSGWTAAHLIMVLASSFFWIGAAFVLVVRVNRNPRWQHKRGFGRSLAVIAVIGMAINILARAIPVMADRPGLAQRVAFAAYFAWFLVAGWSFLAVEPRLKHSAA
ncbi:MAG TPA: DUF998 domain-containing protein [Povalibacter sp.]|nr:DUF998 domain-containing protein [Povalibacter sp.]